MSESDTRPRPLAGVKVVDCTRVLSGPICSRMLSDMGAEVVKVEAPESDILRTAPPIIGGFGSMFSQYNVGKRNVSIDLKRDGGPELLARLAHEADVLVENFRPKVLDRLGLAPARLRAENPGLILCSITGWGQEGPWADHPAYAPIVQAEAGILAMSARLHGRRPRGEAMQHADLYAGMMACQAILAGLFHRERTGEGQHLDVAMGESLLYVNEHATAEWGGYEGSSGFPTWRFETFELANGRSVHIMGLPEQIFPLFASLLPIPGALADPRFATSEARSEHHDEMVAVLDEAMRGVADQASLEAMLAGTPLIVVPVRSTQELIESEWGRHREVMTEIEPGFSVPTAAWRAKDLEIGPANRRIARRGEDNHAVLSDWLNLDTQACEELESIGVLEFATEEPPSL